MVEVVTHLLRYTIADDQRLDNGQVDERGRKERERDGERVREREREKEREKERERENERERERERDDDDDETRSDTESHTGACALVGMVVGPKHHIDLRVTCGHSHDTGRAITMQSYITE